MTGVQTCALPISYHEARKAKDLMDDAERRAIAEAEAAELEAAHAGTGGDDSTASE